MKRRQRWSSRARRRHERETQALVDSSRGLRCERIRCARSGARVSREGGNGGMVGVHEGEGPGTMRRGWRLEVSLGGLRGGEDGNAHETKEGFVATGRARTLSVPTTNGVPPHGP